MKNKPKFYVSLEVFLAVTAHLYKFDEVPKSLDDIPSDIVKEMKRFYVITEKIEVKNTRLMAAAPIMLEALKAVLIGVTHGPVSVWLDQVEAAIKEAEGEL